MPDWVAGVKVGSQAWHASGRGACVQRTLNWTFLFFAIKQYGDGRRNYMSRLEISGYIQIVVGLVGIVLTILTAPALLDAVGQVSSGEGMPAEFSGVGGAIRVFCVLMILFVLVLLVILGLSTTLSALTRALGAKHPFLAALTAVAALVSLAVTVTLGAFESAFWAAGFVGSLGWCVLSFVACRDGEDLKSFSDTGVTFVILLLATGLGTLFFQMGVDAQVVASPPVSGGDNPIRASGKKLKS